MQAQSALARSGRIMGGTLMIGVTPCQVPTNGMQAGANASQILDESRSTSKHGYLDNSHITNISSNFGTPSRSIRPLTQAYKAAQSEHDVSFLALPKKLTVDRDYCSLDFWYVPKLPHGYLLFSDVHVIQYTQ